MEHEFSFGAWLQQRRKALDLTQVELGQCVGCSTDHIRNLEADRRRPSKEIAEWLIPCLQIPEEDRTAFLRFARGESSRNLPTPLPQRVVPVPAPSLVTDQRTLPVPPTPLIGRAQEVAAVVALLERPDVRLVTLTGPGGVGKTRLALQVAREVRTAFRDGVWFVNLAPIRDAGLVVPTIAHTLGVREAGGEGLLDHLQAFLHTKHVLLVLDNVEQVVAAAPDIAALLAAAPMLHVLVTSRAPLHLAAEHQLPVPPLAVPHLGAVPPMEQLGASAAVTLFVQRAQAVNPQFQLTPDNAHTVMEICQRLDGLPLALELAAARSKLLRPQVLLARLDRRLPLLTGGARDLPSRQQTLRATIDWSYALLTPTEQRLFARLAVFVGGCTLHAAEAVCQRAGDLSCDVLDGLQSLLDKNLLHQTEGLDTEPRFGMLETIREYAVEQLEASGEAELLQRRHAVYYLVLAEQVEREVRDSFQIGAWDRLEAEHDNLRTALAWATAADHTENEGLRLVVALWEFWWLRDHLSEGRRWLERALMRGGATGSSLRAKALKGAAVLAFEQDNYTQAQARFEESLVIFQQLGDKQGIAASFGNLGVLALTQANYEQATTLHQKSLALFQELGDKRGIAGALAHLGWLAHDQGNYARASLVYEQSLAAWRELGDHAAIAGALANLGWATLEQGDCERARVLLEDSLTTCRELGISYLFVLLNLGRVALEEGDFARARVLLEDSLAACQKEGRRWSIAWSLAYLGQVALEEGDYAQSRMLLTESLTVFGELGNRKDVAQCLESVARVAIGQGQPHRAARLLGAAEVLLEVNHICLPPLERAHYDGTVAMVRAHLGAAAFATAWAEGRTMPLEEAIAQALEQPLVD